MQKILIADRGPVAVRIARGCCDQGFSSVLVGRESLGTDVDAWLDVARSAGVDAVHPGASALAHDPEFARAVEGAGLTWIGTTADSLEQIHALEQPPSSASRQISVWVCVDQQGRAVVVGDSDTTLQRRSQPIVAEAPAPSLTLAQREHAHHAARQLAQDMQLRGVGTVTFELAGTGEPRVRGIAAHPQPEHGMIETITGIDLVAEQCRIAEGAPVLTETPRSRGHAISFNLLAEDPGRGFLPSPGVVTKLQKPGGPGIRWDAAPQQGEFVAAFDQPSIALLTVHGAERERAIGRARRALEELEVEGIATTKPLFETLVDEPAWLARNDAITTGWIERELMPRIEPQPRARGTHAHGTQG